MMMMPTKFYAAAISASLAFALPLAWLTAPEPAEQIPDTEIVPIPYGEEGHADYMASLTDAEIMLKRATGEITEEAAREAMFGRFVATLPSPNCVAGTGLPDPCLNPDAPELELTTPLCPPGQWPEPGCQEGCFDDITEWWEGEWGDYCDHFRWCVERYLDCLDNPFISNGTCQTQVQICFQQGCDDAWEEFNIQGPAWYVACCLACCKPE